MAIVTGDGDKQLSYKLNDYLVESAPPTVYYIPEYLSVDEEQTLIESVVASPKPKWEQLKNRRLQNYGGVVGKKVLVPHDDIPDWLQLHMQRLTAIDGVFNVNLPPNHVLVNEYLPAQGIMPHTDGPVFTPTICTLSVGCHTVLNYYSSTDGDDVGGTMDLDGRFVGSLLLEPRSLIVVKDDLYSKHLHGIEEVNCDTITDRLFNLQHLGEKSLKVGDVLERSCSRFSFTIRNVPRVSKMNVKLLLGK